MATKYLVLMIITISLANAVIDRHVVPCGTQHKVCKCRETADECEFTLAIEQLQTFTAYKIEETIGYVPVDQLDTQTQRRLKGEGKPFYINRTGYLLPSFIPGGSDCATFNEDFPSAKCTVPLTVDGRTYRAVIAVNGLVPGPTLVVHEGQVIIANVINRMITEAISIHWHGMDQRNTPWMDGAIHITQCPIGPMESFQYYFKAAPTGSFWYHSHSVTQRADGFFGALIVRESAERRAMLENALNIGTIVDSPGNQTLNLHEWDKVSHIERYTPPKSGLYPGKLAGEIPIRTGCGQAIQTLSKNG